MKHSEIKRLVLAFIFSLGIFTVNAQGIVVCKKDGSKIRVPYEQLDSIATYDYSEGQDDVLDGENRVFTVNGVSFTMVPVKAGTFTMGATAEQQDSWDNEKPPHQVTLTNDYYMGETVVTQALWEAVTGYSPTASGPSWSSAKGIGSNYPAYHVSYEDVLSFLSKLNSLTGEMFRMPTEAEWEYAARGGNKSKGYQYSGSNTLGDVAWYKDNSNSMIHVVKTKLPNELGLYDMSGNVWEWCSDWYSDTYSSSLQIDPVGASSGSYRVFRGGAWYIDSGSCRVAHRAGYVPSDRTYYACGFRLALSSSQK